MAGVTDIGGPELHRSCLLSTATLSSQQQWRLRCCALSLLCLNLPPREFSEKPQILVCRERLYRNLVVNRNFQADVLSHLPQRAMQI